MIFLQHLTADLGTVDDDPGRWLFVLEVSRHVLVNFGPWWPHWNFANFKNINLTHEMVIRLTVVCKIPYTWLKCSSLNPCLNLQRVKKKFFQRVKNNSSFLFGFNWSWSSLLGDIFITPLIINSSWVIRMPVTYVFALVSRVQKFKNAFKHNSVMKFCVKSYILIWFKSIYCEYSCL